MKYERRFATLPVLTLVLAGCGGGGGGGGSATKQTVIPITTTEIQLQPNDSWTYNFSGTAKATGGAAVSAAGTLTETVESVSGTTVTESQVFNYKAGGNSFSNTKTLVYTQAADGSTTEVSVKDGSNPLETVTNTTFVNPGTLGANVSSSGTTNYSNGATETDSLTVKGQTQVTTPLGLFNAWSTGYTVVYDGVTIVSVTEDRVPGIGHPAYISGTNTNSAGSVTGTYTLTSTTVPLP